MPTPSIRASPRRLMALAALGALSSACANESTALLAAARFDTLPTGVVQVTNSGPTAWADTSGWKLVLERTIAPPEGEGELARPWSLAADSAGTVYVMDMQPNQIKVFRPDGSLSHVIGREGDGPAEYRPGAIFHLVGDTLIVHDPANARMVRFQVDGTPLGEWPAPGSRRGASPRRHDGAIPAEIILRDLPPSDGAFFARRGIVFFRTDGTPLDTLRMPPEPKPVMWELRDAQNDFGTFVPFVPWQEQIFTQRGTVLWGHQREYRVFVSRTGLDTTRIITAPAIAAVIPDSVRQREFDDAVAREPWIADKGKLADIPTTYPVWTSLATDGANHLWVQRGWDGGHVADVFTPDGILLGTVATPFEFGPRDHWTATHLFHIDRDAMGTPVVQVYRIARTNP